MSRRSLIVDNKYTNTVRNNVVLNNIEQINNSGDLYFNIVSGSATGSNNQLAAIPGPLDGNSTYFLELDTGKYIYVNGYPAKSNPGFVYCQGITFDGDTYTTTSTKTIDNNAIIKKLYDGEGSLGAVRLTKNKSLVIVNKDNFGTTFDCHIINYTSGSNLPTIENTSTLSPPTPSYYTTSVFGVAKMDLINLGSIDERYPFIAMVGKGTIGINQLTIFICNLNTNEVLYVADDLAIQEITSNIMLVNLGEDNGKAIFAVLGVINGGTNSFGDITYTLYSLDKNNATLTKLSEGNNLLNGDYLIQNSPNLFLKNGYNFFAAKVKLPSFQSKYEGYLLKYENNDISIVASSSISETNGNILIGGGPALLGGISKGAPLYDSISNSNLDTLNRQEILFSNYKEITGGYRLSNLDINYVSETITPITTGSDSLLLATGSALITDYSSIGSLFMYNSQTGSFFYIAPETNPSPNIKPFFIDKS